MDLRIEVNMLSRGPKIKLGPEDGLPTARLRWSITMPDQVRDPVRMTCDRPCVSVRGLLVQPGTEVTLLRQISRRAVEVRMSDGSVEVLNPTCFPELR